MVFQQYGALYLKLFLPTTVPPLSMFSVPGAAHYFGAGSEEALHASRRVHGGCADCRDAATEKICKLAAGPEGLMAGAWLAPWLGRGDLQTRMRLVRPNLLPPK
jgi:hypothetical protein